MTYAPTILATMMAADSNKNTPSNFASCSSVTGLKYLKGEKYSRKARFLSMLAMTDRK